MPGTQVHDSLAPKLADVADISANGNGSAVAVAKPANCRLKMVVAGAVTGTTPTLDIEIQSSNDSTFATGVVSHGRFKQLTATDASSAATHWLRVYCVNNYMRYVAVVGGTTPVFNDVTITVEEPNYQRTTTDSA